MDKREKILKEEKKELTEEKLLVDYRSALTGLKLKSKMGQLVQTHQIRKLKKAIARLLTTNNKNS